MNTLSYVFFVLRASSGLEGNDILFLAISSKMGLSSASNSTLVFDISSKAFWYTGTFSLTLPNFNPLSLNSVPSISLTESLSRLNIWETCFSEYPFLDKSTIISSSEILCKFFAISWLAWLVSFKILSKASKSLLNTPSASNFNAFALIALSLGCILL